MTKKRQLKLSTYRLVARAVAEGAAYGLHRYNKYNDDKQVDVEMAAEHVEREVMNALCEVIDFDEPA